MFESTSVYTRDCVNNTNCRCHGTRLRVRACTPKKNRDEGSHKARDGRRKLQIGAEKEKQREREGGREKHKEGCDCWGASFEATRS